MLEIEREVIEDMNIKHGIVLKAIDMEQEMWEVIRNDRDAARQAFVICAQETKAGIKQRINEIVSELL